MILLWGSPLDEPVAAVRAALDSAGRRLFLLDPREVLETEIELVVGKEISGKLVVRDREIALSELSALYVRPADPARIPAVERAGRDSPAHRHAIGVHEALRVFSELCEVTVLNRMSKMASNSSKPFQARLIEESGFATPETLLTTDPDAAREFYERHRDVVYKSVSGVRSIVASLRPEGLGRLTLVQNCPTQFQRRVPGVDHRVHVIGDEVFTTRIESPAIDYRYAGRSGHAAPQMSVVQLPEAVETRCRALARALELPVCGIDLRLTPEEQWCCFEVNPSPAFTFYEQRAQMAEKLAALLARPARSEDPPPSKAPTKPEQRRATSSSRPPAQRDEKRKKP